MITQLIEQAADRTHAQTALTVNTVVEEVTFDFTTTPRLTIATSMPGMISFAPINGGGGATSGGGVSVALGGTIGQAVQTQQQTAVDVNRDLQRLPLVIPRSPMRTPFLSVIVGGGNTIDSQQGIKTVTSALTDIPSAYNPTSHPSCADGIGWGYLVVDGVQQTKEVLIINDNRSTLGVFLLAGDVAYAGQPMSATVSGGPQTVTVYLAG
jgi:hypothetical protein